MSADVTELLLEVRDGDKEAFNRLFDIVYKHLKGVAAKQLNREYGNITMQQTELVHEVFMKMIQQDKVEAVDRVHFYNIAVRSMRQILVDHARKKKAEKRGGNEVVVTFNEEDQMLNIHMEHLIEVDKHIEELREFDERMGKVVELKFFGGLQNEHIAELLNVSTKTVTRDWKHAKAWLYQKIQ